MPNDKIERQLQHLASLGTAGASEATLKDLRKSLNDKVNVIVAKAATLAGEWQDASLIPDLVAAFERLLKSPEADPQCWGKNALSKALKDLGHEECDVFLLGLQHRQLEATWGPKVDTAVVVRGTCALALVQCTDLPRHEILLHLIDSMTETAARVRADAARALEQMGGKDVLLLLRLKARAGDKEVRVTGQVLESILQLEGSRAVPFVASFLDNADEEVREEAALALGASRLPEAAEALIQIFTKSKGRPNGTILLRSISSSRLDSALDFLLDQVRTARAHSAQDALQALELHRDSEEIVKRVENAVSGREDLLILFRESFQRS